jgi:hypothetical protein
MYDTMVHLEARLERLENKLGSWNLKAMRKLVVLIREEAEQALIREEALA